MGFFEYLAFNSVDAVLMSIGLIGFVITLIILIILCVFLNNENDFYVRIIKSFAPPLIIFCLMFFIGLLLPGEAYFREMRLRKNQGKVDEHYLNTKINDIQKDIDTIKDKLNIED